MSALPVNLRCCEGAVFLPAVRSIVCCRPRRREPMSDDDLETSGESATDNPGPASLSASNATVSTRPARRRRRMPQRPATSLRTATATPSVVHVSETGADIIQVAGHVLPEESLGFAGGLSGVERIVALAIVDASGVLISASGSRHELLLDRASLLRDDRHPNVYTMWQSKGREVFLLLFREALQGMQAQTALEIGGCRLQALACGVGRVPMAGAETGTRRQQPGQDAMPAANAIIVGDASSGRGGRPGHPLAVAITLVNRPPVKDLIYSRAV